MRTETQGDLDVRPGDAVTAGMELPNLADLLAADEQQHHPYPASSLAGLAEAEHDADSIPVATLTVERQVIALDDHYDPPTVELYPPRVEDPPPVPDRDEPMFTTHRLGARDGMCHVSAYVDIQRRRIDLNPWHIIVASGLLVATVLATLAVWAAGVDAAPVPHTPPAAPTTGPTPSPLGLSVIADSPAAFVAGVLGLHGGSAVR